LPSLVFCTSQTGPERAYQNQKQTSPDLVLGEIFFGCQVFLFAAITIDYTHTVGLRPAA